jgi:uncharacterized membrane protein
MKKTDLNNRVWELDFFRGIALLLMITFHIVFDLHDIYNLPIYYNHGFFYYVGKVSVILFMLIAGVSSSFSRNNVKRGIKILAIAMGITIVTKLYDPGLIVMFGVLHFFGVSMILYPIFKPLNKYWLAVIGTLMIVVGSIIAKINMPFDYLFPIGLTSSNFFSSDYYPLLPWMGIFLYGIAMGKILYKERKSVFNFSISDNVLSFLGRNTLIVYVIHQPIIVLVLDLIFKKHI